MFPIDFQVTWSKVKVKLLDFTCVPVKKPLFGKSKYHCFAAKKSATFTTPDFVSMDEDTSAGGTAVVT